ncbi:MAG TPA: IS4 family transposase [Ktedonobacteraceae bacterium]
MSSIAQVSEAIEQVLSRRAKEIERETGFVERSTAQLDGPTFVQTTVFGWMDNAQASYAQLRHVAASLEVSVSSQAVEQRFGVESAALLREVLQEAVGAVLTSEASAPELLSRFKGVYVQDGTIISLPPELRDEWRGCGGSTPEAGVSSLRVQVRLDLAQAGMQGPWLQEGRAAERSGEAHEAPLPQGCLYNVDAGYFTLSGMRAHGKAGCYWLTAANAGTLLIDERGQCWDLVSFLGAQTGEEVDVQVFLGKRERLPVRLIARRVSPEQTKRRREKANRSVEGKAKGVQRPNVRKGRAADAKRKRQRKHKKTGKARLQLLGWTILITNVPKALLSVDEALVLARCRWQIELCWKLWKQVGKVDTWRSAKPYRILTEIYAKLLGCLISHWLTLLECWQTPNRSLVKARQVMQWMAPVLALGVAGVVSLETMVQRTSTSMATGCTVNARQKKPATYQLVAHPKLIRGLG